MRTGLAAAFAALALVFFTTDVAAQRRYHGEQPAPASAATARFSALWLPDATVTVLIVLKTDRIDGTAAFRAIYRIDCATNTPLSVSYESFDAQGASLGSVNSAPEDIAASFERLEWERPCPRNDPSPGVAIDPPPAPAILYDSLSFARGLVEDVAEAIVFTRTREAAYAEARHLSPIGHWRFVEGLPATGATYAERGPVDDGRRRIDLVFVPNDTTDQAFAQAPYAYERIGYSVACRGGRARVLYRLRASADHDLIAHRGESPDAPFSRLMHRDALAAACAGQRGAEFRSLSDVLRDAQERRASITHD